MLDKDKITSLIVARMDGRSLREVAEESGIPYQTMGRLKNGFWRTLDADTLHALSRWLGVAMEALYLPVEAAA